MMSLKTVDKRTIKTKRAIQEAFVELMKSKDISRITITSVTKKANINRKTFYLHYTDSTAVLTDIEDGIIDKLLPIIQKQKFSDLSEETTDFLKEVTMVLLNDKLYYDYMMNSDHFNHLFDKIKKVFSEELLRKYGKEPGSKTRKIYQALSFEMAGCIEVIHRWIFEPIEKRQSIDELCKVCSDLMSKGFAYAINISND